MQLATTSNQSVSNAQTAPTGADYAKLLLSVADNIARERTEWAALYVSHHLVTDDSFAFDISAELAPLKQRVLTQVKRLKKIGLEIEVEFKPELGELNGIEISVRRVTSKRFLSAFMWLCENPGSVEKNLPFFSPLFEGLFEWLGKSANGSWAQFKRSGAVMFLSELRAANCRISAVGLCKAGSQLVHRYYYISDECLSEKRAAYMILMAEKMYSVFPENTKGAVSWVMFLTGEIQWARGEEDLKPYADIVLGRLVRRVKKVREQGTTEQIMIARECSKILTSFFK